MPASVNLGQITDIVWLEQTLQDKGVEALLALLAQVSSHKELSSDERFLAEALLMAIRLEREWLRRYPESLFQTLWNRCWWFDSPEAAAFYSTPPVRANASATEALPWERQSAQPLYRLAERWRQQKEEACPGFAWFRSLRPPEVPLGYGLVARTQVPLQRYVSHLAFMEDERFLHIETIETVPWANEKDAEPPLPSASRLDRETGALVDVSSTGRRDHIDPEGRGVAKVYPALGIFAPAGDELLLAIDTAGCFDDDLSPTKLVFSPDGRYLALYGWIWDYDGAFVLWEVTWSKGLFRRKLTPSLRRVYAGQLDREPECMAFSSDSRLLGFGMRDCVAVWDVAKQSMVWEQGGLEGSAYGLAFSANGQYLARASGDRQVTIWSRERVGVAPQRLDLGMLIGHVQFSPKGTRLYTQPWLWDGDTGRPIQRLRDNVGEYLEGGPPHNACYLTDARLIRAEWQLCLYDARTGASLQTLEVGSLYQRTIVAYAPDGSKIALCHETRLQVLSLDDGTPLFTWQIPDALAGPTRTFSRGPELAFSQDGQRLLLGLEAPHFGIFVFDVETGESTLVFEGHHARVTGIAVSPDNEVVASSGLDESLVLWRLQTGEVVAERPLDEREHSFGLSQYDEHGNDLGIRQVREWLPTQEALARLDGWEGFRWVATRHAWHTKTTDDGVFCVCLPDGEEAVWFPLPSSPVRHHSGRIWATDRAHFALEGDPFVKRRALIAAKQAESLEEALFQS